MPLSVPLPVTMTVAVAVAVSVFRASRGAMVCVKAQVSTQGLRTQRLCGLSGRGGRGRRKLVGTVVRKRFERQRLRIVQRQRLRLRLRRHTCGRLCGGGGRRRVNARVRQRGRGRR